MVTTDNPTLDSVWSDKYSHGAMAMATHAAMAVADSDCLQRLRRLFGDAESLALPAGKGKYCKHFIK